MDRIRKRTFACMFLAVLLLLTVPYARSLPSNTPSRALSLLLTVVPSELPSDGGQYPAAVVSLVDAAGLPSAALQDTTVFLSSSQTNIALVPDQVVIKAGTTYSIAQITTTSTPGATSLTASSLGLASASSQLSTATPSGFPSKLRVFVSPSELLARSSDTGTVRVELLDDAGLPSKSINSMTVQLTSSNASIASLDQTSLTLQPGDLYASGTFHTGFSLGNAVITASSTGFLSGGAIITVIGRVCLGACAPSEILLKLLPPTLPADSKNYGALEVGLADSTGSPTVAGADTIVQLFSSNPDVVSVSQFATIPAGRISTLATLTTSSLAKSVSITASATGLLAGSINVQSIIPPPSRLQVFLAPASISVGPHGILPILAVQLQDSGGNPARARQDTDIVVTSSNGTLIRSSIRLTIGAGNDYVSTPLNASGIGRTVLTASSQGLGSSQANLQLVPWSLNVQLTTAKSVIFANETAPFTFTASFVATPLQNVTVNWTASGGIVTPKSSRTGSSGVATATFSPTQIGAANVTATTTSPGTGPIKITYPLLVVAVPPKPPLTVVQFIVEFWYIWVAVVVVVILISYYFFRRRRAQAQEELEAAFEALT
jgi:hypothetical protein